MFERKLLGEILERSDILKVVSRYTRLEKQGQVYCGPCPFHKGRKAMIYVLPEQRIWHCFDCGESGDVFSFIMKAEGLDFVGAVEFLAKTAGIPIPSALSINSPARQRLLRLCKEAARYFYDTLWLKENQTVQQYLADRGLTRRTINRFGLGYAPEGWSNILNAMTAKGYSRDELVDSGLVIRNKQGYIYDRFRGRVIIPIIDANGNVVGFGGRVLDDSKPKYLNSPKSVIFHKGDCLFGLNRAKNTQRNYFILAEGYMDTIALHQAGFDSAVASLGTALTEQQAHIISRYTQKVVVAYDSDAPGQNAAQRAIPILKTAGIHATVLHIPGAKDPDEFIKKNGAEAFQQLLKEGEKTHSARNGKISREKVRA